MSDVTSTYEDGTRIEIRTIRREDSHSGRAVEASVELVSGFKASVSIYGPELRYGGQVVPARVNWSGCGSQDLDAAMAYGNLLRFAAVHAETLPGPVA